VAYESDESGKSEIYVRPFPTGSGKWQVSAGGGVSALWRRDGKELYYSLSDGTVRAVDVNGAGSTFQVGAARKLFTVSSGGAVKIYDVTADGRRYLVGTVSAGQVVPPLTVVTNWDKDFASGRPKAN
jgi:serine/threonine-protein kinase